MQQIISRFPFRFLVSSLIILVCLFSSNSSALAAWSAPTSAPPNGNPEVPVNTSATAQTKSGDLTLGGLGTFSSGLGIAGGSFGFLPSGSLKFMLPFDMAAPAVGSLLVSTDTSGTAAWAATSTLGLGGGAGVTWPLRAPAGASAAAPSYSFAGSTSTGFWSGSGNMINFATGGVDRMTLSNGLLTSTVPWRGPAGTAAFPALSFSSFPNSGIFQPSGASSAIGFATGGTERVRVSATGDVGIGTASPGVKLEVAGQVKITGGSPAAGRVLTSDATGLATWADPSGSGGSSTFLGLTDTPGSYAGQAGRVVAVNAGANALEFVNIAPGGGPGTGTINKLPKWGTTSSLADSSITDAGSSVDFTSPITNTSGAVFNTGGAATGLIVSAGNVGLGTATPGAKLEVAGQVKITGGSPGANKVLTSDATGLATWQTPASGMSNPMTALGDLIYGGTSGTPARLAPGTASQVLTMSSGLPTWQTPAASQWTTAGSNIYYNGGVVGVGGSPSTNFHVQSGTGAATARVESTVAENEARLELYSGSQQWRLFGRGSDNNFGIFDVGGNTKFRINGTNDTMSLMEASGVSSGYVGIGTASPNTKLHVKKGGNGDAARFQFAANENLVVTSKLNMSDGVRIQSQSDTGGSLQSLELRASKVAFNNGYLQLAPRTTNPSTGPAGETCSNGGYIGLTYLYSASNGRYGLCSCVQTGVSTYGWRNISGTVTQTDCGG